MIAFHRVVMVALHACTVYIYLTGRGSTSLSVTFPIHTHLVLMSLAGIQFALKAAEVPQQVDHTSFIVLI